VPECARAFRRLRQLAVLVFPRLRRYLINVRPLFALAAVTVALSATGTAYGVIGGSLDAGRHQAVGALLVPTPNGLVPECSGVLVSPRVFLTAGHCTNAALAAGGAYVVFGDSLEPGSWTPIHGTAVTDPAYGHDSADPHDLGVILLDRDAPVAPATLPATGAADRLAKDGIAPVSVGYGYSQRLGNKDFVYDGFRHAAAMPVVSETSTLLRISSQTGAELCFGDSGGPQYLPGTSTVVSVTSGGNSVCKGNATATRLDSASARSFLASVT
jgi:secreted trypsin-like serine protease